MARLVHPSSGKLHTLGARNLVGRSAACAVTIDDRAISGEHASLVWTGAGWELRDLGSRNGTFVDGVAVPPGQAVPVGAAHRLGFGRDDGAWQLAEDGPPVAQAIGLPDGPSRSATGGLLLLPDEEEPVLSVFEDADGRWVCDGPEGVAIALDQGVVRAGEQVFRLFLPTLLAPTVARSDDGALELRFRVSDDEEYVELDVVREGRAVPLGARSANYLLLTLARRRLQDAEQPAAERGWIHQEDLARMLRVSDITVGTQVHRARAHLAAAGVEGAGQLVERRHRTRQLRIGTDALRIGPLG